MEFMLKLYLLEDNGLRCFKPPCFSWNVTDVNTGVLTEVSRISFSDSNFAEPYEELISLCYSRPKLVEGHIEGHRSAHSDSHVTLAVDRILDDEITL